MKTLIPGTVKETDKSVMLQAHLTDARKEFDLMVAALESTNYDEDDIESSIRYIRDTLLSALQVQRQMPRRPEQPERLDFE